MKKTAVVILNWNGKTFLEKFLPSIVEYSINDAEVIVADNASTDDSVAFLKENYPQVRIIQNDDNYLFAKGYNVALSQVDADYFVLLNSDIEVTSNWIPPVIELMEKDDSIAICQPKLLSYYEKDSFEYAGAAGGFIDNLGYPFCRGRLFNSIEKDNGQYSDEVELFWATGAALFVKSSVYKELGGLDDDFLAHMEEIDFCWRAKNAGYKIKYCPNAEVYHIGGGTLSKQSPKKTYLNFRNNLILLYKNLPKNRLFIVFFMRFFLDIVAGFKFLCGGSMKEALAVTKAYIDFLKTFKSTRRKRKSLQQNHLPEIYRKSIVFHHYILGKKLFSELNKEDFSS